MKLFGNDAVYLDGCFYRFDFGYREMSQEKVRVEAQKMIVRGLQRSVMPINRPYGSDDFFHERGHEPLIVKREDRVGVTTIYRLEEERRIDVQWRALASATTVRVIRFPKQQRLHGAVLLGLPAPMWLVEVDRNYEAGWVLSRRVTDIDKEAIAVQKELKSRERAEAKQTGREQAPLMMFQQADTEQETISALAKLLGGHEVQKLINPLHSKVKLRMVNLFEGWPHIEEIRDWISKGHSEVAIDEAGACSYQQMQRFHALSRTAQKTAASE